MKITGYFSFLIALIIMTTVISCKNEAKQEVGRTDEDKVEDIEKTSEETPVDDLIQVKSPQPNTGITSPLQIKGKARGTWYFEGNFPVRLLDSQGNELAVAIATAQTEWMTKDWVDFEGTMEFQAPDSQKGVLVFVKSNPSDMRELDREFRVEVRF